MLSTRSKKIIAAYLLLNSIKRRKITKCDIPKKHIERTYGEYSEVFKKLKPEQFFKYLHMTKEQFNVLYSKLEPKIKKHPSNLNVGKIIPTEVRLVVTLRTLVTGNSFSAIANSFCIKRTITSRIVKETCKAINMALQSQYIPTPTINTWREISDNFYVIMRFPNCIGALGKRYVSGFSSKSGSPNYKYNPSYCLLLTALIDVYSKYVLIEIENHENSCDKIFSKTYFEHLCPEELIPYRKLPGTTEELPLIMAANEEFPLKFFIMRPYPNRNLTSEQQIFNNRMLLLENLANRTFNVTHQLWGIMLSLMKYSREFSTVITTACCVLHNFLLSMDTIENISDRLMIIVDDNTIQRIPAFPKIPYSARASREAVRVRQELTKWLILEENQF